MMAQGRGCGRRRRLLPVGSLLLREAQILLEGAWGASAEVSHRERMKKKEGEVVMPKTFSQTSIDLEGKNGGEFFFSLLDESVKTPHFKDREQVES